MSLSTILKYINYQLTACNEHDLHSPFLYNFYMELIKNKYPFSDFKQLQLVRTQLLQNQTHIGITDFGAGSKKLNSNKRRISDISKHGIATQKQAEFIYRLLNAYQPKTIIELGTSLGLTTLYLAKSVPKSTIYTIEGCPNLFQFSYQLFHKQKQKNIHQIQGNFDIEFPKLLQSLESVDFIYIDGNHAYEPTMRYFKTALTKKTPQTIMMFDDINWSNEMQKAWKDIQLNPEVTLSLDFFYFGLVLFRTEHKEKEHVVIKF
ncbi:MAG: class I SAM-dependent methyltransferase [Bacteroidia bacterium]|nr:class I SAM-dependent methyltransferase [Bacteroidia bacterium]